MSAPVGETDLRRLLAGLSPALEPRPRAIRSQPPGAPAPADAIMVFHEAEGTTAIVDTDAADADEPRWAQIVLRIHSSLEAVGMMAAISAALAARDIPCNVVSAYFHDHLFVPWARREEALAALRALSAEERAAPEAPRPGAHMTERA